MNLFAKQKERHRHNMDTKRGKEHGINRQIGIYIYTLSGIKQKTKRNNCIHRKLNSVLYGDLNGKEIQKRGDICIHMTGSLCCTAENNNIVNQLYSNKKLILKRKKKNIMQGIDGLVQMIMYQAQTLIRVTGWGLALIVPVLRANLLHPDLCGLP